MTRTSIDAGAPGNGQRELKVFLSHIDEDKLQVLDYCDRLAADGFEPWLAERELLPGQVRRRTISRAVRNSDAVVVFLSQFSMRKAGFGQKEIRLALDVLDEQPEGAIFLIPARLEPCAVPDRLRRLQTVDLFATDGYDRLKRALLARARNLGCHSASDDSRLRRHRRRAESRQQQPHRAFDLFISYAHEDESLRQELEQHLALLQRKGEIRLWHDRKIAAGDEWRGRIDQHLEAADLILLLVSASFLASDYCFDVETVRALERHDLSEARVIPVIVRPCDWVGARFAALPSLPRGGEAVTAWSNRDQAWLDVAQGLREAIIEQRRA